MKCICNDKERIIRYELFVLCWTVALWNRHQFRIEPIVIILKAHSHTLNWVAIHAATFGLFLVFPTKNNKLGFQFDNSKTRSGLLQFTQLFPLLRCCLKTSDNIRALETITNTTENIERLLWWDNWIAVNVWTLPEYFSYILIPL